MVFDLMDVGLARMGKKYGKVEVPVS